MIQSSEYIQLISHAQDRNWSKETAPCYTETHHIIPKCCNGTDDPSNLVELTLDEHYLAHLYLAVANDAEGLYESLILIEKRLSTKSPVLTENKDLMCIAKEEYIRRASARAKELWATQEYRDKVIQSMKASWNKERRDKYSALASDRWNNNEYRDLMHKVASSKWDSKDFRAKRHATLEAKSDKIYVTPFGESSVASEAARLSNCNRQTLLNRCKNENNKEWYIRNKSA